MLCVSRILDSWLYVILTSGTYCLLYPFQHIFQRILGYAGAWKYNILKHNDYIHTLPWDSDGRGTPGHGAPPDPLEPCLTAPSLSKLPLEPTGPSAGLTPATPQAHQEEEPALLFQDSM